jgi:membrane protein required for beta-lactamase induction
LENYEEVEQRDMDIMIQRKKDGKSKQTIKTTKVLIIKVKHLKAIIFSTCILIFYLLVTKICIGVGFYLEKIAQFTMIARLKSYH